LCDGAENPRVFRVPLIWLVGPVAVIGCIYLFFSLPSLTQKYFLVWNVIGVVVYFLYSMHNSRLKEVPVVAEPERPGA
jgi:APA family basic amino acid/polyamine antiporter